MNIIKVPSFALGSDIKELEIEALEALKNNKTCYHIIHDELELTNKEVKDNLGDLLDLLEDVKTCESCPGLESCPKAHPCFCLHLDYVAGQLTRTYAPCQKKKDRDELLSRFFIRDFPLEWLDKDLRNVDLSASRRGLMLAFKGILENTSSRWLYVTGNHRQGKSFVLAMMASEYGKTHRRVAFASTAKLIDSLKEKAIKEKERFAKNMATLQSCPLLVLDEFGNEYKSDFVFSNILYPLLSSRAKKNLPTWFTSDFSLNEIANMYGSKIGSERKKQFLKMLQSYCENEIELDGVALY